MPPPDRCFITESSTDNFLSEIHAIEYITDYAGKRYLFRFPPYHKNSDFVEKNKFLLKGLILNNKFPYETKDPSFTNDKLERIIRESIVPSTPKEKLDNLLEFLSSLQGHEGEAIEIYSKIDRTFLPNKLYFKNFDEYWFYLQSLKNLGLIVFRDTSTQEGHDATDIHLTYHGLEYLIEISESGANSKNCFIAMSFSGDQNETRETIKTAVRECNYTPILVDELHFESEITINDAIISSIKASKFLVADFTEHKHGVYFEAGYALGNKKPVIYMCSKKDFEDSHFDINHYPHIIYESMEELRINLINKIKAWID